MRGFPKGMDVGLMADIVEGGTAFGMPPFESTKPVPPAEPRNKGGRPKGYPGTKSKMPSALAQAFKRAGLDWREDFALAIKANKRDRIKLWLKLLPYLITSSGRSKVKRWKGRPSKAAMIALEAMEAE